MRTKYDSKLEKTKIREAYVEVNYDILMLVIKFENGYKKSYPLNDSLSAKSKASAVIRLFEILEVKRNSELIGKEVRLLYLNRNDGQWEVLGIGHINKDLFMPAHRGDCSCDHEIIAEKIILGKTW